MSLHSSRRHGAPYLVAVFAFLCAILHGSTALSQSGEEPYRLNIGDVLAVSVVGRAELSGDFPVAPDGTIAFPLLGNIAAAGLTPSEVSATLNRDLSEHVPGLSVTAAVSQYAPVFIVGEVQAPGRYEYRPGMTTLELVALGGGLRRGNMEGENSQLQMIAARHDYTDLELQIFGQEAARARLRAELNGTPLKIDRAANDPDPARRDVKERIMKGEQRLFEINKEALASEEQALLAQEQSYDDEIEKVTASIELHNQEIELLIEDVAAQKSLVERGLSPKSRLRDAERALSSMRRDALDLGAYLARAQQNKLAVEQRRIALITARRNDAAKQLQEIELNLARMKTRQLSLLETMSELALVSGKDTIEAGQLRPSYGILRMSAGRYEEVVAGEQALLRPGDIVRVELPTLTDLPRASLD